MTTTGPYAVLVKDFLEGGLTYTVSLVGTNGQVAAGSTVSKRTRFAQVGNLSTSATALYYLDGDFDIRYLRPDGQKGLVTHINLGPFQVAAFAVSPDDRRIAVSVLDYTKYPVGTRLYVEDVNGGGNHVELFSSPTVMEWPAGWHNGRLVMALGLNAPPQNAIEGFSRGRGYHLADAQTGVRLLSLCDAADSYVPESPAGTVCVTQTDSFAVSWDGTSRRLPKVGGCPTTGPLSPDGVIADRLAAVNGGCGAGPSIYLLKPDGSYDRRPLAPGSAPEGWIDRTHLVVLADIPPNSPSDFVPATSVVDIVTGTATPAQATGFFATTLPGGL